MKALISLLLFLPSLSFADVSVPRAKQYAWSVYDVSVLGGASVPGAYNSIPLGLALPAGAVITEMYVYINTQFAATGTESLAFQCAGAQDLMAFTTVKNVPADRVFGGQFSASTFNGGAALIPNAASAMNFSQGFGSVPANCNVQAVIQGAAGYTPYTAGRATLLIEYFRL